MFDNQYYTNTILADSFKSLNNFVFTKPKATYTLYGDLTNNKKLALIFHGFSSNSEIHTWWQKFPIKKMLKEYNILCINSLGSCHGSLGPHSINPSNGKAYLGSFPHIQIQDTVNFTITILDKLHINKLDLVFGCSLGGMQSLDMFIRYPEYSKKYISVCGSPLPLTTKLINAAQVNMLESSIKKNVSESDLRLLMGYARLFFRLSCTTEKALSILIEKQSLSIENDMSFSSILENYFITDGKCYENEFSPYSYNIYMKMLLNFEFSPKLFNQQISTNLVLVDITGDQFTPPASINKLFNTLIENNYSVKQKTFETDFGHEAWILDGENFYEFIKDELVN